MIAKMLDLVLGCRHRRFTRPITPAHKPGTHADSYVACLECGKQFNYDTTNMRMGRPVTLSAETHKSGPGQFQPHY